MVEHLGDGGLLTAAEERELAHRIEAGALAWEERHLAVRRTDALTDELLALERRGQRARQRFVQANLGLVARLMPEYTARTGLPRDELFQEGCLGLVIAVTRFDHRRGLRFSTYAVYWIRARLGAASLRRDGILGLSAERAAQLRLARAAEDELVQTLGRDATTSEIAGRAGLDPRRYERLLAWQQVASLDEMSELDRMTDPTPAPDAIAERPELPAAALLLRLEPLERAVLRQRYGFDGDTETSFAAVARRLGLSVSAVRRIEARALGRLRAAGLDRAGRMSA